MQCVKCGNENSSNAKFCRWCGNNLEGIEQEKFEKLKEDQKKIDLQKQESRKKEAARRNLFFRKIIYRILAVVLGVVIILFIAINWYDRSRSSGELENKQTLNNPPSPNSTPVDSSKEKNIPPTILANESNIEQHTEQQELQKREHVSTINSDCKNAYTASVAYLVDNPSASNITLAQIQGAGYNQSAGITTILYNVSEKNGTIICSGPYEWGVTEAVLHINTDGSMTLTASKIR